MGATRRAVMTCGSTRWAVVSPTRFSFSLWFGAWLGVTSGTGLALLTWALSGAWVAASGPRSASVAGGISGDSGGAAEGDMESADSHGSDGPVYERIGQYCLLQWVAPKQPTASIVMHLLRTCTVRWEVILTPHAYYSRYLHPACVALAKGEGGPSTCLAEMC